jgi:hypothetical protein
MASDEPGTDAVMRQALSAALPADEPPIGLEVADIMRRGRRRYRVRRAVPMAAAAAVAALLVAVPLTMNAGDPAPDHLPMGGPATSAPPSSTPRSAGSTPAESDASPQEFRAPAGHRRQADADSLTDNAVARLPAGNVAAHFGTRSDAKGSGDRFGFGLHVLWHEGGRYGYLGMLHRTEGDFPASVFGLPDEPCLTPATRLPQYHCTALSAPAGSTAYSYEIDDGFRVRGVVWDKKDPARGPDIRVTAAFLIPEPGEWTPFPVLDDGPRMTNFPLTADELADLVNMPR